MRSNQLLKALIGLSLLLHPLTSSAQMLLTEKEIIKMAKKTSPRAQQIESQKQAITAQQYAIKSQYDPKLDAGYSYAASNENPIFQFAFVYKPQKLANLGVTQKTSLGTTVRTNVFSQQLSTADGFLNNATQVGVQLGVEIDIWKNILGRLDRSQLNSIKLSKKITDLQSNIDKHAFVIDVRKTFWTLIANQVSLDLSEQLVKTAKQQLAESKRKLREGLGDSGDIARNQAQLQSRESSALIFAYQKEVLMAQLRSMLPSLDATTFIVNGREALDMEIKSKQCMGMIATQPKLNTEYSRFDDIVGLLDEKQSHDLRVARATDSFDVKLKAQYQATGVDDSHNAAYDRLNDNFRNGYQVGVALNIPLGGDLERSRKAQVMATQNQLDAQKNKMSLQLGAEHQKIQRAITVLIKGSESQAATVESLKKSLKRTRRKYKQARVSLNTYILEQDNLFSSELQLIETKRQILLLLLDYFKVFSKHPCQINVAQGVQS